MKVFDKDGMVNYMKYSEKEKPNENEEKQVDEKLENALYSK